MLMIGRALLGRPKVLLIDEPTEGLAPAVVEQLGRVFEELKGQATLLMVEQNLPLVGRVADVVYAVKEGRVVAEITDPDAIRSGAVEAYL